MSRVASGKMLYLLFLFLPLICMRSFAAPPREWDYGEYAFNADNVSLKKMLTEFSKSHGVKIHFSAIDDTMVRGDLRADNSTQFLNRVALKYSIQWFFYDDTLYISNASDRKRMSIPTPYGQASQIKDELLSQGVIDPRFGWSETNNKNSVIVSGPAEYVRIVNEHLSIPPQNNNYDENMTVMVFPLKYGSVDDRTIKFRGQELVIPGMARLLNDMLGSQSVASGISDRDMEHALSLTPEMKNDISQVVLGQKYDDGVPPVRGRSERISYDVRTNSILVYDDKRRFREYSSLIAKLDIPNKLIEIDALIVDVDKSQLEKLAFDSLGKIGSVGIGIGVSAFTGTGTLLVSDYSRFISRINALESEGTASIIANPSLITLENQPAVLDVSDTAFKTATAERYAMIKDVTAGTGLRVTPRAIKNGDNYSVQLKVDVEDGKLNKDASGEASGVKNSYVSTQALVAENGSVVLGGIHTRGSEKKQSGIPYLRNIPLLGKLFESDYSEESNRERIFIITPHLLGDQIDPSRYVFSDNRGSVRDSMKEIADRRKSIQFIPKISQAMKDLAEYKVPRGMQVEKNGLGINVLCTIPTQLNVDINKFQSYSNNDFRISVFVVKNISNSTQRLDESVCRSEKVLAVSVWPSSVVPPNQSSEVIVAYDDKLTNKESRKSLLSIK